MGSGAHVEAMDLQRDRASPDPAGHGGDVPGSISRTTPATRTTSTSTSHRPEQDGWQPVPPSGETTYEITVGPAGLHPYHCHTAPLAEDIPAVSRHARSSIRQAGGHRPPRLAWSFRFSDDRIGRNGIVARNGVAGFYHHHPIKVPVVSRFGSLVNMLEHQPSHHSISTQTSKSIRRHGRETVFSGGHRPSGMAGRAMLEFTLPTVGRYMFHPHQHWLENGGHGLVRRRLRQMSPSTC